MMYSDPARIRTHTVNVRLSEIEFAIVRHFVDRTGGQLAAVLRDLALSRLDDIEQKCNQGQSDKEGAEQQFKATG